MAIAVFRNYKTTIFPILIGIILLGYLFFWCTPLLFRSNNTTVTTTVLGVPFSGEIPERSFTVARWQYSPSQSKVEIEVDIQNTAADGVDTYSYEAASNPSSDITVTPLLEEPNYAILQLENVSTSLREFVVRIVHTNPVTEEQTITRIYAILDDVPTVETIETLTTLEYRINRLNRRVDVLEEENKAQFLEIENLTEINQNLSKTNEALTAVIEYSTNDEMEMVQNQIDENLIKIQSNERTIEEIRLQVQENQAEMDELEQRVLSLTEEESK